MSADGFRNRGRDATRLEAFVDAAFAFALTLLVISFNDLPRSSDDLIRAFKGVPAFAFSFALIASFWLAHERYCRRYGLEDRYTTLLSLILVFLVLIFVYPLRAQIGSFFAWVSGGYLPSEFRIRSALDLKIMFMSFGACFALLSSCIALMYRHAYRLALELELSPLETQLTRITTRFFFLFALVGLLSFALAYSTPDDAGVGRATAPGVMLFGLQVLSVHFSYQSRKLVASAAS